MRYGNKRKRSSMHIHILGICGTFMGGAAILARQLGHKVTGCDANVYPPMSTLLASEGIDIIQGYDPQQLTPQPDLVVIGNAMKRGNPCVEYVLDHNLRYTSGPQWLFEFLLKDRWVLGVSGTHGKTTTASMLAWILEYCGYKPGYLIGGVPGNFTESARLGDSDFFVVEADEYDSAFFDKRSKFVHYHPKTLIVNNIEFDHADIFENVAAIRKQFHHLVRTVPSIGRIIAPFADKNVQKMLAMGCWSELEYLGKDQRWDEQKQRADGSQFDVIFDGKLAGKINWDLIGDHNVVNAIMAIAAARHVGVEIAHACEALDHFINTKRRLELKGEVHQIQVYDDFAHHPTAIATTLAGLRAKVGDKVRILAVLEPRSNTMKLGVHNETLAPSLSCADEVFFYQADALHWDLHQIADKCVQKAVVKNNIDDLVQVIVKEAKPTDVILVMSNGGFGGIHSKLLQNLI